MWNEARKSYSLRNAILLASACNPPINNGSEIHNFRCLPARNSSLHTTSEHARVIATTSTIPFQIINPRNHHFQPPNRCTLVRFNLHLPPTQNHHSSPTTILPLHDLNATPLRHTNNHCYVH